nr:retrotransposon protein, putative, Ty3-gypsy subclass [Tanacetum cinerariifolium]
FLRAAAGTEEEQAKNFQWGLRKSTLNHLMCMLFTDVAHVANAARDYEILHERGDDDAERPNKRQKSGDRHQPTTQQSSHRNHSHNNDRYGSNRQGGSDNHRSSNNNYSEISVMGVTRETRVSSLTDLPIMVFSNPGVPLRATPTRSALRVDADTQESVVELLVLASSVVKLAICRRIARRTPLRVHLVRLIRSQTFKTLCLLNYALMIRHDYDLTSSLRRGALQFGYRVTWDVGIKGLALFWWFEYHPGKANVVADALSRKSGMIAGIKVEEEIIRDLERLDIKHYVCGQHGYWASLRVEPDLISWIKEAQKEDSEIWTIIENLAKQTEFRLDEDDVLWKGNRLCVPNDASLREALLTEAHSSPFSIHPGSMKMYHDLKQHFWWSGMKRDVATFVSRCLICQQVKIKHQRASGLFQPLDIPVWKWDEISMDFVIGLPRTQRRHDAIRVVVDRLTKSAHFLPIRKDYSVSKLAETFQ